MGLQVSGQKDTGPVIAKRILIRLVQALSIWGCLQASMSFGDEQGIATCIELPKEDFSAFEPHVLYFWMLDYVSDDERHQSAVEVCRVALKESPYNVEVHFRLGSALVVTGQYDAAVEHLDIAYTAGNRRAGYVLGMLGYSGLTGDADVEDAISLLVAAGRGGVFEANYALAKILASHAGLEGEGRRNLLASIGWYCRAGAFEERLGKDVWRKVWQNIGISLAVLRRELRPEEQAELLDKVPECRPYLEMDKDE